MSAAPLASPTSPHARRIGFVVLLASVACLGMGQTIVFAVLPPLARQIGFADVQVGVIFMLSAVFWVALSPIWGRKSDVWGRKPCILLGLSGFVVSMVLFASALQIGVSGILTGAVLYALIVAMRSIYGIVGSATPAAAQAYIADRTPPEKRTAGLASFSAAFGFGAVLGPGFGGAVAVLGPVAPLYAIAALAACAWIAVAVMLPEKSEPTRQRTGSKVAATDRRIRPFLIYGVTAGLINSIPIQIIGFYFMDTLHLSPETATQFVGVGLTASSMAMLFSQLVLVQRFGLSPRLLMRVAPGLIVLGHGLIALSTAFGPLVFGLMLAGLGSGMATPAFTAGASLSVGTHEQGSAAGLTNAAAASGFIFAPLIGFSLYALSPNAPFFLTMAAGAGLLVFALKSRDLPGVSPAVMVAAPIAPGIGDGTPRA